MITSVIGSVLVVVAALWAAITRRPPWALQPATSPVASGIGRRRARAHLVAAATLDDEDDRSIVMDSLRAVGLVRPRVERPVVGRKAYVRVWERVRALIVLGAIVVSLGALLAAVVGLVVLAAGFLLEQAIS